MKLNKKHDLELDSIQELIDHLIKVKYLFDDEKYKISVFSESVDKAYISIERNGKDNN